jgi:hypothetical protein
MFGFVIGLILCKRSIALEQDNCFSKIKYAIHIVEDRDIP